jgi:hypothetical protein
MPDVKMQRTTATSTALAGLRGEQGRSCDAAPRHVTKAEARALIGPVLSMACACRLVRVHLVPFTPFEGESALQSRNELCEYNATRGTAAVVSEAARKGARSRRSVRLAAMAVLICAHAVSSCSAGARDLLSRAGHDGTAGDEYLFVRLLSFLASVVQLSSACAAFDGFACLTMESMQCRITAVPVWRRRRPTGACHQSLMAASGTLLLASQSTAGLAALITLRNSCLAFRPEGEAS